MSNLTYIILFSVFYFILAIFIQLQHVYISIIYTNCKDKVHLSVN